MNPTTEYSYLQDLTAKLNAAVISSQTVLVDAENELEWDAHLLDDGNTVITNFRGEVLDTTRFDKLSEEKSGDHQLIYSGQFQEVLVWRNEAVKKEWRWERPVFADRVRDLILVIHVDESSNGIEFDDGLIEDVEMDAEVIYRRLVQHMQDEGYTYLAGKSKKLVFLRPGVTPEQVLGKIWTAFVDGNKGSDAQFIAGMLLRPGYHKDDTLSVPLPVVRQTEEMDGTAIVFSEKHWKTVLDYFGLDEETASMQVTYAHPDTGMAMKGTISVETDGRPAGTYAVSWKYLGSAVRKSINLRYLSIMNSDFIVNSRSSINQQQMYYEFTREQQARLLQDFQANLDKISDLKALSGAGHVLTAGHLAAEGLNPFYGASATEVNLIRQNMALKSCRNTSVPGWMILTQPSLDLFHNEVRLPKRIYRRFKQVAKKLGKPMNELLALIQRYPNLPTRGALQHYKIMGISRGNVLEVGMRAANVPAESVGLAQAGNIAFTQWGSAQLGDHDGDQGVIYDPEWVLSRLHDFVPALIHNQAKYKPEKGVIRSTDENTRIEAMIKEVTTNIGMGDSAARQAMDSGLSTPEFLEQCSMAIQTAITSKKHPVEQPDFERLPGVTPVKQCAFQQLKALKQGQTVNAFVGHVMLPAVTQALQIADMESPSVEYSQSKVKAAFAHLSSFFSKGAVADALSIANEMVEEYEHLKFVRNETADAGQRQEINRLLKNLRRIEIPLVVETQGLFARWKPQGFTGHLTTEQNMRRALMALAIAHQMPSYIDVWALSMDRAILELFLGEEHGGRCGTEYVLLSGDSTVTFTGDQIELVVDENGVAFQDGTRIGRFALDKNVPLAGQYLFERTGGTTRRHVLTRL